MKNKSHPSDSIPDNPSLLKHRHDQNLLSTIALFILLASCSPGPQAGGGIGGTGQIASIASGPITGFGSVFVSGYEYDTGQTSMTIDGKPVSQGDLKLGMVVRVNATLTEHYGTNDPPQRRANTLLFEDTVDGRVQSIAPDESTLAVLGQTIMISTKTIVDASIPRGQYYEFDAWSRSRKGKWVRHRRRDDQGDIHRAEDARHQS